MKHKGDIIADGNIRTKQNADVDGNLNVDGGLTVGGTFSAGNLAVTNLTASGTVTGATGDFNNLTGPTRTTGEFKNTGPTSFYNILTTSSGVQNREVVLPNTNKNVSWDWRYSNSFFLQLRRHMVTMHTPTLPGNATQVNIVTKQPSNGFYHIRWSDQFKWPDGAQVDATQRRGAVDLFSFHYSPYANKILSVGVQNLFYST